MCFVAPECHGNKKSVVVLLLLSTQPRTAPSSTALGHPYALSLESRDRCWEKKNITAVLLLLFFSRPIRNSRETKKRGRMNVQRVVFASSTLVHLSHGFQFPKGYMCLLLLFFVSVAFRRSN